MDPRLDPLRALYRLADPDRPPPHALHVERAGSIVGRVVAALGADPAGKHVLCGPRGCGKSSELREIGRDVAPTATVIDVELDRSGVEAHALSAVELLYVVGTRALTLVPREAVGELHEALAAACAGSGSPAFGRAEDAVPGVAGFGDALTAVEGAPAPAPAAGPPGAPLRRLILCGQSPIVAASSSHGRRVQEAIEDIFAAVRAARGDRPIVALVDGLDRAAGGDAPRLVGQLFEATRLLTDLSAAMVAAIPVPSAGGAPNGWTPHVVYGFAPDERPALELALLKRIEAVRADVIEPVVTTARLVADAGGHPRQAVTLLRGAAVRALAAGRPRIEHEDLEDAVRELRATLAAGLGDAAFALLRAVNRTHRLPEGELALRLLADGRILVHPPSSLAPAAFQVHPLVDPGPSAPADPR